jgi:hypothetical protein
VATAVAKRRHVGGGTSTGVEIELGKWNWGAFLLAPIWALGHRLWWRAAVAILLGWIPVAGLTIAIAFGLRGNRWAWERESYPNIDDFRRRERNWVKAGLIVVGTAVLLLVLAGALG